MRNEKLPNGVAAALLACALTLGGIGCLVTGFGWETSLFIVACTCAVGAVLGVTCGSFRIGMVPVGLAALLCGYLWQEGSLESSLEYLLYRLSVQYNSGYGCGLLYWGTVPTGGDVTLALCLYGALAASLLGWFLVKGWIPVLPGFLALLPVMASLVLIDTVPDESWLFVMLLGLCLILLTQSVRRKGSDHSGRLTALLLAPVAAALAVLFLLIPQDGYNRQHDAQALEDWAMQWFETPIEEVVRDVFSPSGTVDERVNLQSVGPQRQQMNVVMEVAAQETGTLYLRGQVYDRYDGLSWTSTAASDIPEQFAVSSHTMELTVKTRYPQKLLYLPYVSYYPLSGGRVENTQRWKQYTVTYAPLIAYHTGWDNLVREVPETLQPYLQLSEQTKQGAGPWLPEMEAASAGGIRRYARAVANMVSKSADYDLGTKRMPFGEKDFALWFLEESDTGYCIHFASAAAVLLRAAGIPARYVTGYLVSARAGETVQVHQKDAHAWVEYYIPGIGWQVLEATPAGGSSPVSQETESPIPTEPETQSQETQQTQATQSQTQKPDPDIPVSGGETPETPGKRKIPGGLGALLWMLILAAAVCAQWQLRLWLRRKRFMQGSANTRALLRFRQIRRHCRTRKSAVEKDILLLAQKAKFSQHIITEEELACLDLWLENSKKEFRSQSIWLQPVYTLILALY